jgi:transposase
VTPVVEGFLYMTADKMDSETRSKFLKQISHIHKRDFMIMVLDGAPSHKGKKLKITRNIALMFLPSYSPELNPAEHIWNVLRRDYFANKVFDSLNAVTLQAEYGLAKMASNRQSVKRLTSWSWINVILNAH